MRPTGSARLRRLHHTKALLVVTRAIVRVDISRITISHLRSGTVDPLELALIAGTHHVLSRLGQPAIDKVPMETVRVPARKLQRCLAIPAVGQSFRRIEAHGEPQLWDALHSIRAAIGVLQPRPARVPTAQRVRVHAVWESKLRLQTTQFASCIGPAVAVGCCLGAVLAPPAHGPELVYLFCCRRAGVAGDRFEVSGEGDLGSVDLVVVCFEVPGLDWDEVVAGFGVQSRVPCSLHEYISS